MVSGPCEQFGSDLAALIAFWKEKPVDDRLTFAEMVGVIECKKLDLVHEMQSQKSER